MGEDAFWTKVMRQRTSRRTLLRAGALTGVGLWASSVLGCGGSSQQGATLSGGTPGAGTAVAKVTPKYGGELRIGKGANPTYVDPMKSSGGDDVHLYNLIYTAYLLDITDDGQLVPSVAESWTVPDPKTVIFKIRPGVKFHDGTDVDSAAVKFCVERGKDAKFASPRRSAYLQIDSVDTLDPLTVKLNLTAPSASLLYGLRGAGPLLSPTAIQKWGDDFERHVVSAGPFQLESYTPDRELVFKRFENYFEKDKDGNQLPYLDRIRIQIISDPTVMVSSLEAGDIDVIAGTGMSAIYLPRVEGNRNLSLVTSKASSLIFLQVHWEDPPTDNLDLRKAISYGIDRNEIVKSIYDGHAAPAATILPASMGAWLDPKLPAPSFDPAKAKEYLAKAGYPNGLKLKAATYTLFKDHISALQAQLSRVGIDLTVDVMDTVAYGKAFRETKPSAYPLGVTAYGHYADPDQILTPYFSINGGYYIGREKVPEVESLLEKGRSTYDIKERQTIYYQLENFFNDRLLVIPLINSDKFMTVRSNVKGFTVGAMCYGEVRRIWLDK